MQDLQFERPTPSKFGSIRYQIARRVHGQTAATAGATADLETELWLMQQDAAKAAALLQSTADAVGQPA